jgi:hypothetical protein
MELLFAAIALPCLTFAFADYLAHFLKNWKDAGITNEWKPREDDKDYEDFKEYW